MICRKMTVTLYHGDCLVEMDKIEAGSVDLVLTDPPYGTTACKWDSIIPLDPMWAHLKRIAKPYAAKVLFSQQPFTTTLISSNIEQFKYDWVWKKTKCVNFQQAKNMPLRRHESICVFSEGAIGHAIQTKKRMNYNPQGIEPCDVFNQRKPCRDAHGFQRKNGIVKGFKQTQTGYPDTLLVYGNVHNPPHPTQKPVPLMEYLIKTYTNEGDTVLDFTMGSGSTGVACMNTGRKFIGIERDDKYFKIAQNRIADA